MAFFTRKGLTVPEFPSDSVLTEEPEEFNLPSTPSSLANSTPDETTAAKCSIDVNSAFDALVKAQPQNHAHNSLQENTIENEENSGMYAVENNNINAINDSKKKHTETKADNNNQRFDYVVDRTYGVEV